MDQPKFEKYGRLEALINPYHIPRNIQEEAEVFEKLDGGNCQVRNIANWNLLPGSKANFLKGKEVGASPWFAKFTKWVYSNSTLYNLPENLVLFGEWSGNHTIKYKSENVDKFFVIDLLDLNKRKFLEYENARNTLEQLDIQDVKYFQILARGKITPKQVENILEKNSDYYDGPKEGVVVKSYECPQKFYKLYHSDFSEVIELANGKLEYLTPARYRKTVFKILEDQAKRKVSSEELMTAVRGDVKKEHGVNLSLDEVKRKYYDYGLRNKLNPAQAFIQ